MPAAPSLCNFGFALPGFDILDFLPIPAIPAVPSIVLPTFGIPTCLADLF